MAQVSDSLAQDLLGYFHRAAASVNQGQNAYPYKASGIKGLTDGLQYFSPRFYDFFKGAIGDAQGLLTVDELKEVMTQAGEKSGGFITHHTPADILQEITDSQFKNITVRKIFPQELRESLQAVGETGKGLFQSLSVLIQAAPWLYAGAGLVGAYFLIKKVGASRLRSNPGRKRKRHA